MLQQVAPSDQHARRARAADELVRAEEDRVLVRERITLGTAVHVDVDIGRGGGEIPERQRAVLVQKGRDPVGVADDSGDVAGCGERPDLHRAIFVAEEFFFQRRRVDVAVRVLRDDDDVGDRFAPRQLVRVMLERPNEYDGPFCCGDRVAQVITVVQLRGDTKAEDPDELVDRARAARASEDHHRLVIATHCIADDPARVLAQAGGLQAGAAGLGVGVGVARQDLVADEVLDEAQRPAGRRVVGVGDAPWPVGSRHDLVIADDGRPDTAQQCRLAQDRLSVSGVATQVHALTVPVDCRSRPG